MRTADRPRPAAVSLTAAAAIGVEVAAAAAGLTNGEVGSLALGSLAFGARQGCANQAAMHRTLIVTRRRRPLVGVRGSIGSCFRARRNLHRRFVRRLYLCVARDLLVLGRFSWRLRREHTVLFPARRGHTGLLVFVVSVARRAAGLLHLIVDHRDDRMIRDAALARTVVVQNVTEPKPALLH